MSGQSLAVRSPGATSSAAGFHASRPGLGGRPSKKGMLANHNPCSGSCTSLGPSSSHTEQGSAASGDDASALRRFGQACSCYTCGGVSGKPKVMDCPRHCPLLRLLGQGTPLLRESSGLTRIASPPSWSYPMTIIISQIHRQRVMQRLLRRKCRAGGSRKTAAMGQQGMDLSSAPVSITTNFWPLPSFSAGQPSNFRPRCLCARQRPR